MSKQKRAPNRPEHGRALLPVEPALAHIYGRCVRCEAPIIGFYPVGKKSVSSQAVHLPVCLACRDYLRALPRQGVLQTEIDRMVGIFLHRAEDFNAAVRQWNEGLPDVRVS